MTAPRSIEIELLDRLTDVFGLPDAGHQETSMNEAVARLVALARQHQAQRTLRRYSDSADRGDHG